MFIGELWENLRWEIEDLLQFETNDTFWNKYDKCNLIPKIFHFLLKRVFYINLSVHYIYILVCSGYSSLGYYYSPVFHDLSGYHNAL